MIINNNKIKLEILLGMSAYDQDTLKHFQIVHHRKFTHSPTPFKPPAYGKRIQYTINRTMALLLYLHQIQHI